MIRVLVVDDEPMARAKLCRLLRELADVQLVGEAGDADEAIAVISSTKPDLVVCDLHMPRRDGLAFTNAAHRIRPTTPVVLMTSFACADARADAAAVGASGLLSKPFSIRELREAIDAALAPRR